ncbi:hypothetical protein [Aureimonas glaciei]|uniref:hypothetical protein n=1 Tax=Aureimonas glaciei TaxID=1776957 RepID=UPI00166D1A25|nr:hypothetical protein [Aureimonas glaciei]
MGDDKLAAGLGGLHLAASAVIATLTVIVMAGQNEFCAEQGRQNAELRKLVASSLSLSTKIDRLDSCMSRIHEQLGPLTRP